MSEVADDCKDNRVGAAFGNPDCDSNHYYSKRGVKGWGKIVTPDELRYDYLWGNPLTSSRGDNYVDTQLQLMIDRAIETVEHDLTLTIIATQYRHRPPLNTVDRTDLPYEEAEAGKEPKLKPFKWDDCYDFTQEKFRQYIILKLRHKPIVKLQKWQLFDISTGGTLINLVEWAKVKHKTGLLRAYPRGDTPFQISGGGQVSANNTGAIGVGGVVVGGLVGAAPGLFPTAYNRYPNGYGLDYIAGYENSKDVPLDLVEVIGKLAAINLMANFGDGVVSGLASASVSLSGISESFGTTLSATSAYFGARIKQFTDEIIKWKEENGPKYRGIKARFL